MALLRLDGDDWFGDQRIFERWGFGAIAIAALLPPPAPTVPFLFAAGVMQYSWENFWWR